MSSPSTFLVSQEAESEFNETAVGRITKSYARGFLDAAVAMVHLGSVLRDTSMTSPQFLVAQVGLDAVHTRNMNIMRANLEETRFRIVDVCVTLLASASSRPGIGGSAQRAVLSSIALRYLVPDASHLTGPELASLLTPSAEALKKFRTEAMVAASMTLASAAAGQPIVFNPAAVVAATVEELKKRYLVAMHGERQLYYLAIQEFFMYMTVFLRQCTQGRDITTYAMLRALIVGKHVQWARRTIAGGVLQHCVWNFTPLDLTKLAATSIEGMTFANMAQAASRLWVVLENFVETVGPALGATVAAIWATPPTSFAEATSLVSQVAAGVSEHTRHVWTHVLPPVGAALDLASAQITSITRTRGMRVLPELVEPIWKQASLLVQDIRGVVSQQRLPYPSGMYNVLQTLLQTVEGVRRAAASRLQGLSDAARFGPWTGAIRNLLASVSSLVRGIMTLITAHLRFGLAHPKTCVLLLGVAAYLLATYHNGNPRRGVQTVVDRLLEPSTIRYPDEGVRLAFNETFDVSGAPRTAAHTHPDAARLRTGFNDYASRLGLRLARQPYAIQLSERDVRYGTPGDLAIFWEKDGSLAPREDPIPERPLFVLTDVDFHMSAIEHFLATNRHPVVIYTCAPKLAAGTENDCTWHFKEDGRLHVSVNGDTSFTHMIWDWTGDVIGFEKPWYRDPALCGYTTVYKIESRAVDSLKTAILLVPIYCIKSPAGWANTLHRITRAHRRLKRFDPIVKGTATDTYVKFEVVSSGGREVQIGICGSQAAISLSSNDYTNARKAYDRTVKPNVATMSGWIVEKTQAAARDSAGILLSFFLETVPKDSPTVAHYVPAPNNYSMAARNAGDVPYKGLLVQLCSPLDPNSYNPARDTLTLKYAIKERILAYSRRKTDPPPARYTTWAREFVHHLKLDGGCRVLEWDEILERQEKKANHVAMEAFLAQLSDNERITVFAKAEPMTKPGAARVISSCATSMKGRYLRYVLAVTERVKETCPWYGFRKPTEIAEIMGRVGALTGVVATDFTKFDATINTWIRELVHKPVLAAAFPDELGKVMEIYTLHVDLKSIMPIDIEMGLSWRFDPEASQRSGAADTSVMNTLTNAFLAYASLRSIGLRPGPAWTHLCDYAAFGGDDGALGLGTTMIGNYVAGLETCSKDLSLHVKAVVTRNDSAPHKFLSRMWWPARGTLDSMCEPRRAVTHIHWSPSPVPDTIERLRQKATALLLTDGNTPIVGVWARAVTTLLGTDTSNPTWWSAHEAQFPNEQCDWMISYTADTYPEFDQDLLLDWAARAESKLTEHEAEYLAARPPVCVIHAPVLPPVPIVLDGDVVAPEVEEPSEPSAPPGTPAEPEAPAAKQAPPQKERRSAARTGTEAKTKAEHQETRPPKPAQKGRPKRPRPDAKPAGKPTKTAPAAEPAAAAAPTDVASVASAPTSRVGSAGDKKRSHKNSRKQKVAFAEPEEADRG